MKNMLGKTLRGATTLGLHIDFNANGASLQLRIHFTQLRPVTGTQPDLDLDTQLQAVPISQALRGRVSFATPLLSVSHV